MRAFGEQCKDFGGKLRSRGGGRRSYRRPVEPVDDPHERLAAAVQRLGELIITRPLDDAPAAELAARITALAAPLEVIEPAPKTIRFGGRNRVHHFLEHGTWPPPPPDGSYMDFDVASIVGGELNPFGMGTRFRREGDEAVGVVTVSRCFEGPPGRVHGGVVCSILDEVMGSVFRANGTASAFTGELSVRFEQAAPIEEPLEFRAHEVRSEGRKRFLEATGASAKGRFATATAVFIDMKPEHLPSSVL